jgi:hypothetical protein
MLVPRSEIPKFAIVSIVSQPHLWTDEEDLSVVNDDSTVVDHILVHDWPGMKDITNVTDGKEKDAHMPISHIIPCASSDAKIFARTSQE